MLDGKTVFEKVCEIIGESDDSLMPFCENAAAVINGKMRSDVNASDIRLLTAAASVAYCDYLMVQNVIDGDIGSVRAGDITVSRNGSSAYAFAENFRKKALSDAAELLLDNEFSFRAV